MEWQMSAELLLGDEAVARGAIDEGIGGAFSYPGTPATEIFEYIRSRAANRAERPGISAIWSTNEKTAYEEALGMSYVGKRALVSMKHVGLNVAADPFMNSALTGVNAGMVVVIADDPGMHSSQNEQDSRFYGDFAKLPMYEPANQQEAYEMTREAFQTSEAIGLPVMMRLVTRLCHSRANVETRELITRSAADVRRPNPNDWTLVPVNARRKFQQLVDLQPELVERSQRSSFNKLTLGSSRGVLCAGLAYNYVREALNGNADVSLLHVGLYPLPVTLIRELVNHCDEILVVEEGYPFIERRLQGLLGIPGKAIRGKLTGDLPSTGELSPDALAQALGRPRTQSGLPLTDLAARPPQLCRGCPHSDSFRALVEATSIYEDPVLFSDIGCYTLGVLPPFRAVHACLDMGASISMALGASRAGKHPVVCTIGDGTFAHSGMTGLISAARQNANMTVLILDNATVAMTGGQLTMTSGEQLLDVLRGLGVDPEHTIVLNPVAKAHKDNVEAIRREIAYPGLSVVIPQRACIHSARREKLAAKLQAAS